MKKLLKIAVAMVVLVGGALVLLPGFISADFLKEQIKTQVKNATGRELKIDGAVSVSVFPSIAVEVGEVTFSNPAGFSAPFFVKVEKLSVGAALRPLLNKELRITDITIAGATLNLEESASGRRNWDFVGGKKPEESSPEPAKKTSPEKKMLVIEGVHIRDSAVNYRKFGGKPMQLATTNISADIALNGDVVDLSLDNATLYGGSAKGTVQTKGVAVAMDMALSAVELDPLMVALTGASKLEGKATLALDVKGAGKGDALMRSLNGEASVKLSDGAIKGINVASFLRDAKRGFVMGGGGSEKTDFTELTASFAIANGVAHNEDLSMKSPILRLIGKGDINLGAKTIDYRAVPSIVGTLKGQGGKDTLSGGGVDVPLFIKGPWSAISVTPDMAGLVEGALANPAEIGKKMDVLKEAAGDLNSPEDIGKALLGGTTKGQ